jgi:hypothetical protein
MKKIFSNINEIARIAVQAAAILASGFIGYIGNDIYRNYQNALKPALTHESRKSELTSVAINERNELLIFNRETGSYTIYAPNVGNMIFNLYANRIHAEKNKDQ